MLESGNMPKVVIELQKNVPRIVRNVRKVVKEVYQSLRRYEEPYCEISQDDKQVRIHMKMPEVNKMNVQLVISKKKIEVKGMGKKNNYFKIIDIPPQLNIEKAHASYDEGRLKLTIPRLIS